MELRKYFHSLTDEFEAMKNRIRDFMDDPHWLTDGEWKEAILRTVLTRHLPRDVEAVRGFVLTAGGCSSQIDVLLYDNSKPALFRDGDLVFVTPDAAKGIVEVKASVASGTDLKTYLSKLAKNAALIRNSRPYDPEDRFFAGLFSYECALGASAHEKALDGLEASVGKQVASQINYMALGKDLFTRYWNVDPTDQMRSPYAAWHSYDLNHQSYAYFVNNILYSVADVSVTHNSKLYFPHEGKGGRNIQVREFTT